mgnify:CR=1 FL=1
MGYFDVANSPLLYLLAAAGILYIVGLSAVFLRKAWKRCLELGISRQLDLKYLQYALAVARCGSVTQAARELYLAQPNLSRAVAELNSAPGGGGRPAGRPSSPRQR